MDCLPEIDLGSYSYVCGHCERETQYLFYNTMRTDRVVVHRPCYSMCGEGVKRADYLEADNHMLLECDCDDNPIGLCDENGNLVELNCGFSRDLIDVDILPDIIASETYAFRVRFYVSMQRRGIHDVSHMEEGTHGDTDLPNYVPEYEHFTSEVVTIKGNPSIYCLCEYPNDLLGRDYDLADYPYTVLKGSDDIVYNYDGGVRALCKDCFMEICGVRAEDCEIL